MINLVTVCTDVFPMIYVYKLHRQFKRLTNLDVRHYCITDRPDDLPSFVSPILPFIKSKGWWNKINLYSPKMPSGRILYMDLDIVILNNFDEEISAMTQSPASMCCVSDALNWKGVKFNSSLMSFDSGIHVDIFDNFSARESQLNELDGGDQVWTGPQLSDIHYIDESFPNLKKNLKFQLAQRNGDELNVPMAIDDKIKLVDCSGRPKPHELEALPYIKKNWHDI